MKYKEHFKGKILNFIDHVVSHAIVALFTLLVFWLFIVGFIENDSRYDLTLGGFLRWWHDAYVGTVELVKGECNTADSRTYVSPNPVRQSQMFSH